MILIDMDMPDCCMNCELRYKDSADNDYFTFRCKFTEEQITDIYERMVDCPIIKEWKEGDSE